MRNLKSVVVHCALTFLIGSLTIGFAQTRGGDNRAPFETNPQTRDGAPPPLGFHRGGLHPRVLEQLNLSEAQKEQINALQQNAQTTSQTHFEKLKAVDEQLKQAVESSTFNEAAVREFLAGKSDAMIELELVRLKTDAAVRNLLTAEQKVRLETLKQERPDVPRGRRPKPDVPQQN